jgi:signal transduction histidine kinase/CheY-like chemotaxis protein
VPSPRRLSSGVWKRVLLHGSILGLAVGGWLLIREKHDSDVEFARASLNEASTERTEIVEQKITTQLDIVYHYLHSIGQMPAVRESDWAKGAFDKRAQTELSELHSELQQIAPVTEIHLVRTPTSGSSKLEPLSQQMPGSSLRDVPFDRDPDLNPGEIAVLRKIITTLRKNHPTLNNLGSGEHNAMITRPTLLDETLPRHGNPTLADLELFYCVPAYDLEGRFKGAVVAEFPLDKLRASLPKQGCLLLNSSEKIVVGDTGGRGEPLAFSQVRKLHVFDSNSDWRLSSFVTETEFRAGPAWFSARLFQVTGNLLVTVLLLVGILVLELGIRWPEKLERDILDQHLREVLLRRAKDEAERANQAKSEFLSRMSHELRTPLNSVLGYAQLLDLQYKDPRIKTAVASILRAGRHLLGMINEILDISSIESGARTLSLEQVPIREIVQHAVSLIQPIADGERISVALEADSCDKLYVQADRQRLLQIFINLLSNAVKFNRPCGQVVIRCTAVGVDTCRIEVSDTGSGIAPENRPLLFKPFQRFGDPGVDGAGLGLALSASFVKLMGGSLQLLNSSPDGSTFCVELKQTAETIDPNGQAVDCSELATYLPDRRGTILYIEDNPANVRLLEAVLAESENVTLIPAIQGLIGRELAREHHPDLILLDQHLPDIMGDQVLSQLKADPETRSIPVVILSADATEKQISALLARGAAAYLTKPIDFKRLFELFREYLPEAEPGADLDKPATASRKTA